MSLPEGIIKTKITATAKHRLPYIPQSFFERIKAFLGFLEILHEFQRANDPVMMASMEAMKDINTQMGQGIQKWTK